MVFRESTRVIITVHTRHGLSAFLLILTLFFPEFLATIIAQRARYMSLNICSLDLIRFFGGVSAKQTILPCSIRHSNIARLALATCDGKSLE